MNRISKSEKRIAGLLVITLVLTSVTLGVFVMASPNNPDDPP